MIRQTQTGGTPIMTGEQHYRDMLRTFPSLSKEQEQVLVQRAHAGENVRDEIILSLQPVIYTLAGKYAGRDKALERMDFVQEANVAMLYRFDLALTKRNPFAYLFQVAWLTMIECLNGKCDLIKTYRHEDKVYLVSLDQPLDEDGLTLTDVLPAPIPFVSMQEEVSTSIQDVVEALPEKHRMVIQKHYGIGEHEPISLNAVSRFLSQKARRPSIAHYYHKRALASLNVDLAPIFPQYAAGGAQ